MPAGTAEALAARTGMLCDRCGLGVTVRPSAIHHRLPRSGGGTWALSNLLLLHSRCHNTHHESVHEQPARSYTHGYLVRRGHDPATVPVLLGGTSWVLLGEDGTASPCQPPSP